MGRAAVPYTLSDAQRELAARNYPLALSIAKQRSRPESCLDLDDMISAGTMALCRAAYRYKPDRGVRFSTYAFRSIHHAITCAIRREARRKDVPSASEYRTKYLAARPSSAAERIDMADWMATLTGTQQCMIEALLAGRKYKQVALDAGISVQGVHRRVSAALETLP